MDSRQLQTLIIVLIATLFSSGCATFNAFDKVARAPDAAVQVAMVRGKPNKVIDSVGVVLGIPNRLAILNEGVDNHNITAQTETELSNYIIQSELNEVLVRVNQYDPLGEWKRLATNKRIRPFWRLTFGTYDTLKYTFLPGRLLGGDWYNPFTDTLNIYSDVPELAISEAAYAADVRSRRNPGAYAALKEIPFVGLSHQTRATDAALQYYEQADTERYQQARDVLIPNSGANWGGQLASFLPYGAVIGRVIGGVSARAVEFTSQAWR